MTIRQKRQTSSELEEEELIPCGSAFSISSENDKSKVAAHAHVIIADITSSHFNRRNAVAVTVFRHIQTDDSIMSFQTLSSQL